MAALNQAATVEYQPLGVIGVIGPWNYPVFTPMGSIAYALAAGNAVVFKPSELTPASAWLVGRSPRSPAETAAARAAARHRRGATGAALCRAPASTRSPSPARPRPRARSWPPRAETLTPVLPSAAARTRCIVDADADLEAAADAAAWGALSNAGQTCIGIERVYVADAIYDAFVAELADRGARLRPGSDEARPPTAR